MKWEDQEQSENVEDTRGSRRPAMAAGGGIGVLLIMAVAYFMGIDPNKAKQVVGALNGGQQQQQVGQPPNDKMKAFSASILGMTEKVWGKLFQENYRQSYEKPRMTLFSDEVNTKCGLAPSAVGPFYCPADKHVYLDPSFFDELETKLGGSKADFSKAYVIAHEVGHHVQNLLGYNSKVDEFKAREGENSGIRLELQADYLAGVWAHHAEKNYRIIEKGDVESALKTARSIGDNRIQEKMRGKAWPESFNHGRDDQRIKYFSEGLKTGDASKAALDRFFSRSVKPLDL